MWKWLPQSAGFGQLTLSPKSVILPSKPKDNKLRESREERELGSLRLPNKVEVVVLALYSAGGGTKAIDTEDVAVAAHGLAPKAFAWKKHPEQINLDSVRVTLFDACKEKYGALVRGSMRAGWHLTPAGVTWIGEHSGDVVRSLNKGEPGTVPIVRAETRHSASELARIRRSDAFVTWSSGRPVSPRSAAAIFRIDASTSARDRELKVNRAIQLVAEAADEELQEFVDEMSQPAMRYEPIAAVERPAGEESG